MAESKSVAPPLASGLFGNLKFDAFAGFFVFLIAMPLCLAIAGASGYPPIAGIWTAVIGGILCTFLSNAQLTIKGPAAGLIVIVAGSVAELGAEFRTPEMNDIDAMRLGYELTLGIGVVAGIIQVVFGLFRIGRLVDLFPLTPVHGMLASIGIIIIVKQLYPVFGLAPTKDASIFQLIGEFPGKLNGLNPEIAIIGISSLAILFGLLFASGRFPILKKIPAQLVVLLAAVGLGLWFDLEHEHTYLFPAHYFDSQIGKDEEFTIGEKFLVTIPNVLSKPQDAFCLPDFRGIATATGLEFLILFTLIGSLESLLSAKAVELLDPWKRKTNFDRDLLAVGFANTIASAIGGLPMISEIVRSKANIDNGARTKQANAYHGLFLLGFVLLFPQLIHRIPLAALGAMLVYTGFRLASPNEFVRTYKVGSEQFLVFIATIIATLATDLLIGIAVGIGLKIILHLWHGAPLLCLLKSDICAIDQGDGKVTIFVRQAALFSNWLGLKKAILQHSVECKEIVVDLSSTKLVDHSVMEKLHELEADFVQQGRILRVTGMDDHKPLSNHPLAARRKTAVRISITETINN